MFFLPAFADTTGSDVLLDILNEASYKISAIIVVASYDSLKEFSLEFVPNTKGM